MHEASHTPGPLVSRRINDTAKPFAVINPNGPFGDDIAAGSIATEAEANLFAAAPDLLAALRGLAMHCAGRLPVSDLNGPEMQAAAAAIAKAQGRES